MSQTRYIGRQIANILVAQVMRNKTLRINDSFLTTKVLFI
jgi:hypothetical protein